MRRILLAVSVLLPTGAYAADEIAGERPGYDWNGFYIGAGAGADAAVHNIDLGGIVGLNGLGGAGAFGELSIGYDHLVAPRFLIGGFVSGHIGNAGPGVYGFGGSISAEARHGFDAGVRFGYLVTPSALAYVLGGYSWQRFEISSAPPGLNFGWDASGYMAGIGIETALTRNLTLKTEYRYAAYGAEDFGTAGLLALRSSRHTMLAGINYRFGFETGTPAAFEQRAYDWTGFYVGAAVGAGSLVHDLGLLGGLFGLNGFGGQGVFGELGVGYDHEFAGGWVAGVSLGGRYSSIATGMTFLGAGISADADYGFDVLARVGKKINGSTLAYVTGGYSWQHFDIQTSFAGSIYNWGAHGYSLGAGVETAFSDRATLNVEYRYSAYEGRPSSHTVRAGLKFKLL